MAYVELEQFLDRGAIRAWWGFSWKTFLGLGIGGVLGQQLGAVVYGSGTAGMAALTALGAALGVILMLQRRGMIVAKRLVILLQFAVRVAAKRTEFDGRASGLLIVEDTVSPMRVRMRPVAPSAVLPDEGPPPPAVLEDGQPAQDAPVAGAAMERSAMEYASMERAAVEVVP